MTIVIIDRARRRAPTAPPDHVGNPNAVNRYPLTPSTRFRPANVHAALARHRRNSSSNPCECHGCGFTAALHHCGVELGRDLVLRLQRGSRARANVQSVGVPRFSRAVRVFSRGIVDSPKGAKPCQQRDRGMRSGLTVTASSSFMINLNSWDSHPSCRRSTSGRVAAVCGTSSSLRCFLAISSCATRWTKRATCECSACAV
jgi:hypothetical protein